MANSLTNVIPQLLAQGLVTLRENSVMPRLVNRDYDTEAKMRGNTIDIPVPAAITATQVSPAVTPAANNDLTPGTTSITLNQWYEAPFYLTDKETKEVMNGYIPMQAAEAVKAIANNVDSAILALYKYVPNFTGTVGTTPFGDDVTAATTSKKLLSDNLAPNTDRRYVMTTTTEANALNLRAFQDMSFSGDASGINDGKINRKLGFDWYMNQNLPQHTNGTQDGSYIVDDTVAIGDTSINIDTGGTSGSGTIKDGDNFTVAGDDTHYVATADVAGGDDSTLAFYPAAKVAWADNAAITFDGTASSADTHDVDLAFHRDAFAFASRPLTDIDGLGSQMMTVVDEISGIVMRLEVSRQHKQTRFAYDVLYGVKAVRPELACRIHGA